ncbi:MAG TPA: Rdx family protein [Roseiflexaceae bacterium]|nr:Rdx family protein [Roseiflexaceae bacterium]
MELLEATTTARTRAPVKVSIVYCASCGYEPQTLELARALMHTFTYELASIELIPWQDGAFDVVVDGDLVHSMYRDGGFPASETVIQAVREKLGK